MEQAPDGHEIVPFWRIKDKMWNAYLSVEGVRALHEELTAHGSHIDYDVVEQTYVVLEFGIQDLDDQDIGFGQNLTPKGGA